MRPMPRFPRLSRMLARHADRLADAWARALCELPDSHYRQRPEQEIREWTGRGLAAILRSLESGDPRALEAHLSELVKTRERLGFDIEEVLLGLALLSRCALPVLMEECRDDAAGLARSIASLDDCVDAAVARFGMMFARAMRERVEKARRNTARLLEALEDVASPAVLSSVLSVAARHVCQALAASHCAVLVRERGSERFRLGATFGKAPPGNDELLRPHAFDLRAHAALRELLQRGQASPCRGDEPCSLLGGRTCKSLNLAALVALPVLSRRRLAALALAIYKRGQPGPTDDQLRLAQAMASTLGSVIDNARLYAESQRSLAESGTLQQISSALLEESTLADMLELICRESRRLVRASGVVVMLRGQNREWTEAARAGWVAADQARWLVENWADDDGRRIVEAVVLDDEPSKPPVAVYPEKPSISVPLKIAHETVGVLHACRSRGRFGEEDLRLLERIAGQATLAIEHARLHRDHDEAMIVAERHRLSRDLHDSVTQSVYSVTMFAEAATRLLEKGRSSAALTHLRDLGEIAQQALWEMRLLIFELQPPDLDALGLESVLQARLGTVERRAGLKTEFRCEIRGRLPRKLEHGLYRIVQEALNNAIRHARATRVSLTLVASDSSVRLVFEDDGVGFDLEECRRKGGLGLRGMEERARVLGGSLNVATRIGAGTRVELSMPLSQAGAADRFAGAIGIVTE
jgi:signal transduction histidine kinase